MDFPHGVTVTVRSVTSSDDGLGNTVDTVVESAWGPCAVAPRYATESTDPRVPPVVVGVTIYGPSRPLDGNDRLVINGLEYQVDGLPGVWSSPFTGWAPGMEVPAKRVAAS